ncbi:3',5'-cyclic-nucleotide phosphodiesterase [Alteromonas sp. BL110]|uniref:metallophosphoesterase n=1 Tax=Alteromonas sp. BL110 TaxID=1714845 RepID=UPI000E5141DE|nr:metallophosphoesterase [Alteromonas sp. BL110]AXT38010.1 3',5'-cyclic-nucleotide phosphodiesterase [Alteromonas sp. BL110]RKM80750.1 3',5'-cyclic-nucleotide phosphodiesterase [Alteromonas sp. BL110]
MISLIQISDCHLFKDKDKTGYAGIAPYHSLTRVLSAVQQYVADITDSKNQIANQGNNGQEQKMIVLVTGDISGDNSPESYQHFTALMEQYIESENIDWFVLAGNHDNNPHFESYLGSRHLQSANPISFSNWQIHGMDTRTSGNMHTAAGEVKESDLIALKQSLDALPHFNHLVALHHHILPSKSWMDKHFLANAQHLESLINENPQIKALIHGHIHSPLRQEIGTNSTPSYGSPSTCWQWQMCDEFGVSEEAPGYQVINLMDNGTIDVNVTEV